MPKYKIATPDGRTVTIEAADEQTAIRGAQGWAESNPRRTPSPDARQAAAQVNARGGSLVEQIAAAARATSPVPQRPRPRPTPPRVGTGEDAARSGAAGTLQGAAGAASMAARTAQPGIGASPFGRVLAGTMGAVERRLPEGALRDTFSWIRDPVGEIPGGDWDPQTSLGQWARTAGQMAAGAAVPGSIPARFAAVALPTVGARTGGDVTRALGGDEQQQAIAEVVGSVIGGSAAGLRPKVTPRGAPRPGTPTLSAAERRAVRRVARGADPVDARRAVDEIREFGGEPVLADAIGSRGQARVRAAATRDIPEQQDAVDFASRRRVGAQEYTAGLGERLSPETRSPAAARDAVESARRAQAEIDYAGPYRAPVRVTPEIRSAVADGPGKAAVMRARADAESNRFYSQVDELDALLGPNPPEEISAASLDRIRIALGERGGNLVRGANQRRSFAGGLFSRADDIDAALDDVDGLAAARQKYAEMSAEADAIDVGSRILEPRGVRSDVEALGSMTPDARRQALAGMRNSIEDAASTPGGAATTLDRLAFGDGVRRRLDAAASPDVAADVRRGAERGRQMIETGRRVSPRDGSNTNLNQENSRGLNAAGAALETGAAIQTGGLSTIVRPLASMLKGFGLSNADAGRMVEVALSRDPARLEAALLQIERTNAPLAAKIRRALPSVRADMTPEQVRALVDRAGVAGAVTVGADQQRRQRPGPPQR